MAGHDEAAEVVTSVGPLDGTVVLLRDFLHRSGALRVVALVERARSDSGAATPDIQDGAAADFEASAAVIECSRFAPVEVDLGGRIVQLPHDLELDAVAPTLPQVRQLPPFDVDAVLGEVTGTIGGLAQLADDVRALAAALGARNIAMAVFDTTDVSTPLAITARADRSEPVVVALGDAEFALPDEP